MSASLAQSQITFSVCVGLCQGFPLSLILFVILVREDLRAQPWDEGISSVLFAVDVVLLVSSAEDLQQTRGCLSEQWPAKRDFS